jgi:quinol monooxygenase YgiN
MVQIVWEFEIAAGREEEFERHYGPEGTWVQLFRKDAEFVGTELLRDRELKGRYLTVDRWRDVEAYESFKLQFAEEYERIDAEMDELTVSEKRVGVFEVG